jgi:hypothetical protein
MEMILSVAFVVAAVAFFKQQFGLRKWGAIGCAFVVSLLVAFYPSILEAFPLAAPYIETVAKVVTIFLAAPGVFDLAVDLKSR